MPTKINGKGSIQGLPLRLGVQIRKKNLTCTPNYLMYNNIGIQGLPLRCEVLFPDFIVILPQFL